MAQIITMPRLSDTMTEGTVASWLKKVGDTINEGDILAEIETDKATMEFESFHAGVLLHIGVQEGETAQVDSVLAIIGSQGEDIASLLNGGQTSTQQESKEKSSPAAQEQTSQAISNSSLELPKGVSVVTMPRLSDTMTEGTVASWLKKVGDTITEGDILAEIETDKATMEFESFYAGTLLHIGIQEGETALVDSVLAIIGPQGTDLEPFLNGATLWQNSSTEVADEQESQNIIQEKEKEIVEVFSNNNSRIFASPLAKKIAKDKGVDLTQVKGSGENGRIVKSDVESFKESVANVASVVMSSTQTSENRSVSNAVAPEFEEIKNSSMRKTIARRLAESKFTAPHYYLTIELDMDQAIASRKTINTLPGTKISFNDMVVKACAQALKKHPKVNSQWKDDVTVVHHDVHIGVAVAVDEGLVVPVVNHADTLGLVEIGAAVKNLATKARDKKLQPKEMEGSTFTVSNLGMFGIKEFTSIINQPNSAILSVGAIVEKPVVKNGQIVVGNTMTVTLACDHRTVDGATGAAFLQTLRYYIENPVTMLA